MRHVLCWANVLVLLCFVCILKRTIFIKKMRHLGEINKMLSKWWQGGGDVFLFTSSLPRWLCKIAKFFYFLHIYKQDKDFSQMQCTVRQIFYRTSWTSEEVAYMVLMNVWKTQCLVMYMNLYIGTQEAFIQKYHHVYKINLILNLTIFIGCNSPHLKQYCGDIQCLWLWDLNLQ